MFREYETWREFYNLKDTDIFTGKQIMRLLKKNIPKKIKLQLRREMIRLIKSNNLHVNKGSVSDRYIDAKIKNKPSSLYFFDGEV